jgi:FxsC-like protein
MPYFFLSYASVDGDPYMDTFFRDLRDAVRARTGLGPDDIAFRDRSNLQAGVHWPSALVDAVGMARVFVAMCSPSYFASTHCGKEWQYFTESSKHHRNDMTGAPANLLPVTWIPSRTLPDVAHHIQHFHEEFGSIYKREGLQFLARLRRYRDDYELFVTRFAERIISVGDERPVPAPVQVPDLEDVSSAFHVGTASTGPAVAAGWSASPSTSGRRRPRVEVGQALNPAQVPGGPRHVNFVMVAAPSHAVARIRRETQYYGPSAQDWAPYKPDSNQRICVFAQNIASTKDLTSALAPAESSIVELISRARRNNEVVVLIVDVWTARLDPYHEVLAEYDELNAPTSAVMIPWNSSDQEMASRAAELREGLHHAFPNNLARGDTVFRAAIPTEKHFQSALEEVLAEVQSRVFQLGSVSRRAGGDRIVERPVLTPVQRTGL